jgi:hypothetical protein
MRETSAVSSPRKRGPRALLVFKNALYEIARRANIQRTFTSAAMMYTKKPPCYPQLTSGFPLARE